MFSAFFNTIKASLWLNLVVRTEFMIYSIANCNKSVIFVAENAKPKN